MPAIDILRGFVMCLMAIDHASEFFNGGRLFTDSIMFHTPGAPLPAAQFFTRWMTHLCAPTFVTLAGASLAMATEGRRARGDSESAIDRYILTRGLLIVFFEIAWMSWAMLAPGRVLLQVLYAIGVSLMAMAFLRRLRDRVLLAVGLGLVFGAEIFVGFIGGVGMLDRLPIALVLNGGFFFDGKLIVAYPVIPWLAMMCVGWWLGRWLLRRGPQAARTLVFIGTAGLALFVALRAWNSYGNMRLFREGPGIVQWLHVSKYPPSATFTCLELGIAALLLAALMRLGTVRVLEPLRLLGQTALFFYLLHIHVLKLVAEVAGIHGKFGLASAYVGGLGVVVVLYPACAWYRRYKAAHPNGWARWI